MAYPAVVAPELTAGMIQAGEALLRGLDAADVPVPAAFWLRRSEDVGWRLVIASPAVDTLGQKAVYRQLADRVTELRRPDLSMSYVVAVSPADPTVALLRSAVRTEPGISAIRFTGNVINGVFIPDAHIYRLT